MIQNEPALLSRGGWTFPLPAQAHFILLPQDGQQSQAAEGKERRSGSGSRRTRREVGGRGHEREG